MKRDTENELIRLLALKRHEQPPPGYFNHFSSQVIGRIKAGERGQDAHLLSWLLGEAEWLQRVRSLIEAKPFLAGAFGAVACALLVSGILYSDAIEPAANSLQPMAGESGPRLFSAAGLPSAISFNTTQPSSSTNPVDPSGSLFDQIQLQMVPQAVPVSYPVPQH